ncbi:conjugal transfer mating pair stabilization protein TraG (plasmid) [Rahnella aceris]|uniref:conjugal transfer mating-pair stabilization protein TraG n=1 Tax=Rahnella sp. (strain Y9602) TaxID=2703885 RepID=UPI0019038D24|nr:conjugal transfer mating-pair stabilization protein TraG [Rahnella aceris]QQN37477.1 conjugal transfer mating pair stabilization protein TraG [Rahnella aceris]
MTEMYTIYGGDMWRQVLNGVVTILGADTFDTLLRIVSTFGVLGVMVSFIKTRDPRVFMHWLAVFMFITSVLLVPKRSVQILDITDPAAVYEVDNVPLGLAMIAGLTTSAGFGVAQLYDYTLSRPDSLTYTKSGMLFGSQIVAQTSDFRTQNPQLAQMLTDYVENCVIGDILLNNKYTINQLLNSTDPLTLITNNPSPLRGIYQTVSGVRQFVTCQQAAGTIRTLMGSDISVGGVSWHDMATRVFGSKVNADALLSNAMNDSYGFFYAGGLSASQIMRNNVTNAAIRDGWKGFAARSSDTANLVNLATESTLTKQRLSWAAGGAIASQTLPMFQSLMMLILIGLFPLVIALALVNHTIFGLNTLKLYAGGFLYFQMWPVMFAILNSLANFYLQSKTGSTALVLANQDRIALQHSDVANIAGYLSMSIPVLSFFLTKGAASVASQVVGGVMSSAAFSAGGQASTTADGNWSFNNMSMDNVNANKFDTNLSQRMGQQSHQMENGGMRTLTADGHNVYDTSQAISNLPVNMRLSSLASSGFQEQSRQAQQEAQTALDGYNHSVTSGLQQLNQLTSQSGNSASMTQGSENTQATNATRGASMMMSAAENYAKANNISQQEAYNQLMTKSQDASANAGVGAKFDTGSSVWGGGVKLATGLSADAHAGIEVKGTTGSQHGTQESNSAGTDFRHDKNSQTVKDFRQGMDMVTSARVSESGNQTDNQSNSQVEQYAATLNDAKSQYHQYTDSSTKSQEFSRMATLAQNESASLDANYNQEFVDWTTAKFGNNAQNVLTNVNSAREAATEFMKERLEPEIMQNYGERTEQTNMQPLTPSNSLEYGTVTAQHTASGDPIPIPYGASAVDGSPENANGTTSVGVIETSQQRTAPFVSAPDGHSISQGRGTGSASVSSDEVNLHNGDRNVQNGQQSAPVSDIHQSAQDETHRIQRNRNAGAESVQADDVNLHNRERNLNVQGGPPSASMTENYNSAAEKVRAHAESAGIPNNVAGQVAAQRSANSEVISGNGEKIDQNKTPVQTTSDILKGEHNKAQGQFAAGIETEKGKQNLIPDKADDKSIKNKLDEMKRRFG